MATPPNLGVWFFAVYAVRFLTLAAAIVLARRRSQYAPIAWFLGAVTVADLIRTSIRLLVLGAGPAGGAPYAGLERVAFHLGEQAPFIALSFAVAALAIHVLAKRRAWPVVLAYAVVLAVLVLGYPTIRRELLQSVYLGVTLAALAVSLGAAAVWWRAGTPTTPPETATLLMVTAQGATIAAPYALGLIDVTWPAGQGIYFGIYAILFTFEVSWIRRS